MSDEKHLDATPARLAKARREGNVPRSPELVAAAAFGAAALAACAVVYPLGSLAGLAVRKASSGVFAGREEATVLGLSLLPVLAGAVVAIVAGTAQTGGIATSTIALKLSRLDPAEGVKRMLSRETPVHAARAALAFAAAAFGVAPAVAHVLLASGVASNVGAIATAAWSGARRALFVACAVGALFALAEYAIVRGTWLRKLRMSFDELKREIKEQEGDPHLRARRKGAHRDLARGAVARVREASFVVANPTHVAVALVYRPPEIAVPFVLVRASDAAAARVRELAARWKVPVVEHPLLARALFRDARSGASIPVDHYVAVAEIVVALSREGVLAG